ncbi:hypothetical protein AK95_11470 [Paenibacillus sp. LC231]|uniref:hypothetical protein n=1 Tax=Paenibacillus sp. LC231 TaxID=1120679 RepID=UPI0008DC5E43|nr:hypothetical protein [Paenibacillus sp. LC231]OIB04228.1 hypothetical protein AK95_11470 [Paenibacillus sp. LC231]
MRFKACILIVFMILTGCFAGTKEQISPENNSAAAEIQLTPVDLFQGEAARFKLFLGPMTGAFKLKYEGNKHNVSLDIDIWKNGQKVDSAGSIGDLFYSSDEEKDSNEVELIISVDTESIEGLEEFRKIKVNTNSHLGSSLSTFTIPWDTTLTAQGLIQDTRPRSFTIDQPVHVFGMHATSSNEIHTADLTTDSLRKTEWALVFTLRLDEDME